ncbi:hypothetical protein CONLIGDRAFT_55860 [Coniochaeta ligniaria NRRL 30616]|uniref:Uncharacterized protein n=1 Tax=Coniochaeta ligniaria NRRL 30616 TaxID=1408157 RepID=A0A1J7J5G4_9PEZI|nr:hypothetical protein CONLIGDRAFT_55860 [Coniochaeta ligniaria NRRL 30616]
MPLPQARTDIWLLAGNIGGSRLSGFNPGYLLLMYTCVYVGDPPRSHCLLFSACVRAVNRAKCLCTQLSRSVTCEHLVCSCRLPHPLVSDAASVAEDTSKRCPPAKTCLFLHTTPFCTSRVPVRHYTLHFEVAPAFVNCVCWPSLWPASAICYMNPFPVYTLHRPVAAIYVPHSVSLFFSPLQSGRS